MAVNPAATVSTANGVAKRVHGKLQNLIPSKNMKLTRRVKLDKDNLVGSEYYEPVFLTGEHGATFTGNSGAAATLNGAEVATSAPASLNPSSIWFQTRVVIDSLSKMSEKGDKAFENYLTLMMKETRKGLDKRLEIVHHGSSVAGIGTTSAASATSATVTLLTISEASWRPHVWLNMKNCPVDIYDGATLLNNSANSDLRVTNVFIKTRQIEVTCTDTGDAADIVTAAGGSDIFFKGMKGNIGLGLRDICLLSTGDTAYGIAVNTAPDVWCATQVSWDISTDPEFTWELLQNGIEEAKARGLERDLICEVPFPVWTSLNSSLDALRVFDSSYSVKNVDMGHDEDSITYHSLGIKVKVEASGYAAYGEVLCYPNPTMDEDSVKLIGSSPVTFDMPGSGREMVYQVQGTNQCEWLAFTNQSFYTTAPRDFIYFGTST